MKAAATEETRDLALDLAELDQRLGRILAAALDTFERLQPPQSSRTYAPDGRMRESAR